MPISPYQSRVSARYYNRNHTSHLTEHTSDYSIRMFRNIPNLIKNNTQEIVDQFYKIQKQWQPFINRTVRRHANTVGVQEDLKQAALISIWELLLSLNLKDETKSLNGLIHHQIRRTIAYFHQLDTFALQFRGDPRTTRKYRLAEKKYIRKHKVKPTAKQLADFMGYNITYIREWMLKDSHKFISMKQHESPNGSYHTVQNKRQLALQMKINLEDRFAYWIDRRWIQRALLSLSPPQRQAVAWIMTDETRKAWSTRNKIPHTTIRDREHKALDLLRELSGIRQSQPVDPREQLRLKGYVV